jgi:16S rRNA (guanine1207-N2)-methyltransferase
MAGDHYFTAEPTGPAERRRVEVELAGQRLSVEVAGGVFSPGRVDTGTQVLLREAPDPPATGTFLDLGCGWGPVALTLGLLAPAATVYAVDVNARALDLTRANAAGAGATGVVAASPDEVPAEARFDLIWSNPPIRVGKAELHAMLAHWLPRLVPGGAAYLVVQKNLGADSLQRWVEGELGMQCARYAVAKGFRVLQVSPAG